MATHGSSRKTAPWYADGLRFECRPDCGGCCTDHGEYSYVYLEDGDAERLRRFLGLSADEFRDRHTATDDGHLVLKMDQPECPFLDGARCTVYAARPLQCRSFPFWEENVRSRRSWDRLRSFCPGIGDGPIHPLHVIQGHLSRRPEE